MSQALLNSITIFGLAISVVILSRSLNRLSRRVRDLENRNTLLRKTIYDRLGQSDN